MPECLSGYLFIMPFLLAFLTEVVNLPGIIKYTLDLCWLLLMIFVFFHKNFLIEKKIAPFVLFVCVYLLYVFVVYLFNFQSPFYFLWGVRNNFRVYAAFLSFAIFFDEIDANFLLRLIDVIFWINIAVTGYQFFILGYNQDYLGGIFGIERGCNSYSLVLFAIVLSKSLLSYMNDTEKAIPCFLKCGAAIIAAAMAELKVFFLFIILIFAIAVILTKFSWKKVVLFLFVSLVFVFAGNLLTAIFGEDQQISIDRFYQLITASNYSSYNDLGRLTAIPTISDSFLKSWPDRLFGMGLGNCDTSTFAICNTPFFETYQALHYSWFSSAFLFLETGYVGLMMNNLFFIICLILSVGKLRKKRNNILFCQLCIIMSILCIVFTFYNSSLRTEVGYIAFFILALPFMAQGNSNIQ